MVRFWLLVLAAGTGALNAAQAQQATSSGGRSPVSGIEQLADLDARQPVPLAPMMANHQKQNMRDHLLAVQEIVGALATRDFASVRQSASRIGSSPQVEQMCAHMGAGANGFFEKGMTFHHTADRIIEAAEREDLDATLLAMSETLKTCNSCHTAFRQQIVDETTSEKATHSTLPSHPSAGDQ